MPKGKLRNTQTNATGKGATHHCSECKGENVEVCIRKDHIDFCTAPLANAERLCGEKFHIARGGGCSKHSYQNGYNLEILERRKPVLAKKLITAFARQKRLAEQVEQEREAEEAAQTAVQLDEALQELAELAKVQVAPDAQGVPMTEDEFYLEEWHQFNAMNERKNWKDKGPGRAPTKDKQGKKMSKTETLKKFLLTSRKKRGDDNDGAGAGISTL